MKKRKKYRVYFAQVNQTYFDVEANNEKEAVEKAAKEWKAENDAPLL